MFHKTFAGVHPPAVMGILNVTPDSFSDGGRWTDVRSAVHHAFDMIDAGVDIIDIGGESTRPGCTPVSAEEEISRLEPVLRELIPSIDVPVSVDTMKALVAGRCLELGCTIVNDMYGLRDDGMLNVCSDAGAHVVIAHMLGTPDSIHDDVMGDSFKRDIRAFLESRVSAALDAGIGSDRISVDPGIGFGKTPEQNMGIIRDSGCFSERYPILTGSSRKGFLRRAFPERDIDDVSAEMALESIRSGASIVRVHDVARTVALIRGSF